MKELVVKSIRIYGPPACTLVIFFAIVVWCVAHMIAVSDGDLKDLWGLSYYITEESSGSVHSVNSDLPDWVHRPPEEGGSAVGVARIGPAGIASATAKAVDYARAEIALKVQKTENSYDQTVNRGFSEVPGQGVQVEESKSIIKKVHHDRVNNTIYVLVVLQPQIGSKRDRTNTVVYDFNDNFEQSPSAFWWNEIFNKSTNVKDAVLKIIGKYGVIPIVFAFLLAGAVWYIVHTVAAPGGEIKVLWGLVKYPKQFKKSDSMHSVKSNLPAWVFMPPEEGISAVGYAIVGATGMDIARREAIANARDEIARIINVEENKKNGNFTDTACIGDDKVAQVDLSGSIIKNYHFDRVSSVIYVLVVFQP